MQLNQLNDSINSKGKVRSIHCIEGANQLIGNATRRRECIDARRLTHKQAPAWKVTGQHR